MVATTLRDDESGVFNSGTSPSEKVLPAAVIYGGNAAGKTSVINALAFLQTMVSSSHKAGEADGGVPRQPFRLGGNTPIPPSEFDIDFVVNGVRFHYGFETDGQVYLAEWLHSFPSGRRQLLFERSGPKEIAFGRALKGRNRVIADLMRGNSLFLSAAIQNGHEELTHIYSFFRNITLNGAISVEGSAISHNFKKVDVDNRTTKFLSRIGTGITGFRRIEKPYGSEQIHIQKALQSFMKEIMLEDPGEIPFEKSETIVELCHKGQGADVYFNPQMESAGTRRLLLLVSQAFSALDTGSLLVVDELDASIHTQACEAFLLLFANRRLNRHNAQVIVTTHDTNLLLSKSLRRDQIWFTEKDGYGSTHLFPLSDIETRRSDNIEKGYLQGRFGAIPFSGSPSVMFGEDEPW